MNDLWVKLNIVTRLGLNRRHAPLHRLRAPDGAI